MKFLLLLPFLVVVILAHASLLLPQEDEDLKPEQCERTKHFDRANSDKSASLEESFLKYTGIITL